MEHVESLRRAWLNLDRRRLAGLGRILGIEITESHARVALVARKRLSLNRFAMKFRVEGTASCDFPEGSSIQERGALLNGCIEKLGKARMAGVALLGERMRFVTVPMPQDADDISLWIDQHKERLLGMAVRGIAATYEVRKGGTSKEMLEITFMREAEVSERLEILQACGLSCVGVRLGVGDALLAHLAGSLFEYTQEGVLLFFSGRKVWRFEIGENAVDLAEHAPEEQCVNLSETEPRTHISGDLPHSQLASPVVVCRPFGADPEYALAVGAAIRGLVMGGDGAVTQAMEAIRKTETLLLGSLLKRTVLALGIILFAFLLVAQAADMAIQAKRTTLDEAHAGLVPGRIELDMLRRRVELLEARQGKEAGTHLGSNHARTLHDLASSVPPGVRLLSLSIREKPGEKAKVTVRGSTRAQGDVTEMLRRLGGDPTWQHLRLIEASLPQKNFASGVSGEIERGRYEFTMETER
jgi:hypothetical protein